MTGMRQALHQVLRRIQRWDAHRIVGSIVSLRPRGVFAGPAGAAMLIVCFFLPWMRCSCGPGLGRTVSGVGLGGVAWLALVAPLVVLVAFVILGRLRLLQHAWPLPAAAAVLAMVSIGSAMGRVSRGVNAGIAHIRPVGLDVRVRPGGIGMVAGLTLLLLGTAMLLPRPRPPARRGGAGPAESI